MAVGLARAAYTHTHVHYKTFQNVLSPWQRSARVCRRSTLTSAFIISLLSLKLVLVTLSRARTRVWDGIEVAAWLARARQTNMAIVYWFQQVVIILLVWILLLLYASDLRHWDWAIDGAMKNMAPRKLIGRDRSIYWLQWAYTLLSGNYVAFYLRVIVWPLCCCYRLRLVLLVPFRLWIWII